MAKGALFWRTITALIMAAFTIRLTVRGSRGGLMLASDHMLVCGALVWGRRNGNEQAEESPVPLHET